MSFTFSKKSLILLGLFLLAAIPRAIELLNGNYLFLFDQGLFYQAVKDIVVNHHFTLIGAPVGGRGGFFQGPGWYYLLSIPFMLFRGDPYGGMILMFVLGVGTVLAAYLLGEKMFGKRAGIITGLLFATSAALIPQSRFIWPPFPVSFLTVFFLYFFYKVMQGRKNFLLLAILTIGLMFHFEVAVGIPLLVSVTIFSVVLLLRKLLSWKSVFLSIGAFLTTQLPLIFFDIRHHFLMTRGIFSNFLTRPAGHQVTPTYAGIMITNHIGIFMGNFQSILPFKGINPLIIFAIFIALGVWYVVQEKDKAKKLFVSFLLASPFLLFGFYLFYMWPMWEWWILDLPVMYLFLMGILINFWLSKKIWKFVGVVLLAVFALSFIKDTYSNYKNDFHDFGGTQKIAGKLQAINYIYHDAKGKPFGLLAFTPPVYTYATDYLFWWYGQKTYHYLPYYEKKGTVYLLIEPDPSKPWSYKGWLETVIKDGTVQETVTLPSGYIIQKRLFE